MCDYSMHHLKNRKAKVGDKITTSNFSGGSSSVGLESCEPLERGVAICLIPGTGIEFDKPIEYFINAKTGAFNREGLFKTARYVYHEGCLSYHDYLQFPDGSETLIAQLASGWTGTVVYVPAEVEKQTNAEPEKAKLVLQRLVDILS